MTEEEKAIENIEKELNKKYEVVPLYKDFSINSPMNIVQKHYNDTDIKIILNLISKLQADINKKDKRLNRQFKLLSKKDKEIKELIQDNNHHWEERCKFTFKLEKKQADIEIKDKVIDLMADKLSERSEWYTKERWKEICYKQVEKVEEENENNAL